MSVDWTFGEYKILKKIATGGMAEVFLAKRVGARGFEKLVAIKRVLPQFSENEDFISMFIDEAKLVARLSHRNIVQIYDFGTHQGAYYIAMQYVFGKDVRSILKKSVEKQDPIPAAQAVHLIAEAAKGLEYAHQLKDPLGNALQIIHRDISPQNILVSYEGEVLVADFGIAKAASKSMETRAGVLKGKIPYMSPEQAWGQPIDKRSDLYSLGVVFYELITCRKVFDADSEFSLLEKVRNARVEFPTDLFQKVPRPIIRILRKALQKNPDDRYQGAHEMHTDLENYLLAARETSSERNLSHYLKGLFQKEIEEEKKVLLDESGTPGEKTAVLEPGPEKPLSVPRPSRESVHGSTSSPRTDHGTSEISHSDVRPEPVEGGTADFETVSPEPGRVPLLAALKRSLRKSDVRLKFGFLAVLCILGAVTVIQLLAEKGQSPTSAGSSAPSSFSQSASSSSSSSKIKLDLSKPSAKEEPSKQEPFRQESPRGEPPKRESPRDEPKRELPKKEPSPAERKPDQLRLQERPAPPRREEGRDVQPAPKTGRAASTRGTEVKTPVFMADLLRQGPDLLRENKHDIVLERISRLSDKEKGNINMKILECFAHIKRWVHEKKTWLKKMSPIPAPWRKFYNPLSRSGDRNGTPLLLKIAKDPEEDTRFYAVSLLESIGDQRALPDLQQIASSDSIAKIREAARQAISSIQPSSAAPSGPSSLFPEAR